jgi:hypothetical protein
MSAGKKLNRDLTACDQNFDVNFERSALEGYIREEN